MFSYNSWVASMLKENEIKEERRTKETKQRRNERKNLATVF
jgi:hypothetical protein